MVLYHSWRKSSGSVGTGRRARLRILWALRSCGFKSHLPQEIKRLRLKPESFWFMPRSPLNPWSKVSSALSCLVGRFGGKKVHWTFFLSSSTRNLIIVIFYYQISLNPLKTLSLSQVSFPLDFPLCYIFPYGFTNSDKGKYKGKKIL